MFAKEGNMSMVLTPEVIETEDWSDRLDEFPLEDTLEDIKWDLFFAIAKDNLSVRDHMAEDSTSRYPNCSWCNWMKACNGSLMAFLKAKKVVCCNMFNLHNLLSVANYDMLPSEITR